MFNRRSLSRLSNSQPDPLEFRPAKSVMDGNQTLMTSLASPCLEPDGTERQIQIIMNDQNIFNDNLKKIRQFPDGFSTQIHKGLGFGEQNAISLDHSLSPQGVKPCLRQLDLVIFRQLIQHEKSKIVPGKPVPGARISQSHNELQKNLTAMKL